jgi:hypothetical protein
MDKSPTSRSIFTALPVVAFTIGKNDGNSNAMSTIGMMRLMGLDC